MAEAVDEQRPRVLGVHNCGRRHADVELVRRKQRQFNISVAR
jgi:hypothetical protein